MAVADRKSKKTVSPLVVIAVVGATLFLVSAYAQMATGIQNEFAKNVQELILDAKNSIQLQRAELNWVANQSVETAQDIKDFEAQFKPSAHCGMPTADMFVQCVNERRQAKIEFMAKRSQ